ncbi:MAG: hypothetical protein LBL13_04170 [Bacteroidales bacterium]|jgi:hypothetical protein|nr:hypothetical protein [Bacteroidales bacterium]
MGESARAKGKKAASNMQQAAGKQAMKKKLSESGFSGLEDEQDENICKHSRLFLIWT